MAWRVQKGDRNVKNILDGIIWPLKMRSGCKLFGGDTHSHTKSSTIPILGVCVRIMFYDSDRANNTKIWIMEFIV